MPVCQTLFSATPPFSLVLLRHGPIAVRRVERNAPSVAFYSDSYGSSKKFYSNKDKSNTNLCSWQNTQRKPLAHWFNPCSILRCKMEQGLNQSDTVAGR